VINFQSGPDGAVYFIDWYDKNECHSGDANLHDRSNGRIFKVSYGETKFERVDLRKLSDEELGKLLASKNNWHARHAQRILQERAGGMNRVARTDQLPAIRISQTLRELEKSAPDSITKLRINWTLHAVSDSNSIESQYAKLLKDPEETLRVWGVQLWCEEGPTDPELKKEFAREVIRLAREDKSALVRLYLASAMQRLPIEDRWEVVEALSQHAEDASDHNLPLMVWYAAEPLPTKDFIRALAIAEKAKLPNYLNFTVRRTAALNTPDALAAITKTLARLGDENRQLDVLNGLSFALKAQRSVPMPQGWEGVESKLTASANPEIRALVQSLSLTFGSKTALAALKKTLMDKSADSTARKTALDSLLNTKDPSLVPSLQELLTDPQLQGQALRALAAFDDLRTPASIFALYPSFDSSSRRDALNTLASRASFAKLLLDGVKSSLIPKKDLTADLVRQIRNLKNSDLDELLTEIWGVMRDSAADKQKEIEKIRNIYRAGGSQPGDAIRGRAVFARVCLQCHTLFGAGGKVAPDLTGSNRGDMDYLLQNIVDPNAVIPNDYRAWNLDTKDDRSISGIVKQQDEKSVTIITANEMLTIPRNEIASLREGELSMMPEGLLQNVADQEIRDLIYYLRGQAQAPLIATPDTIALFFNGKDLSNWDGAEDLWRVENGEIIGKTATGLKHNEFLKSQLVLTDFRLTCKMKLVPNSANSGIQFRSEPFGEHEMRGPQADAGAGWWGKLYEENGRAILSDKSGEQFVKADDWNIYEIVAVGGKIRTSINGHVCTDLDDEKISKKGIIGLQVHSGGPTEVRFKDFQLELLPETKATAGQ
jgi:putative heme-binding domain-containing protein